MWHGVLGIVAGAVGWVTGFYVLAAGSGLLWSGYAARGRTFLEEGIYTLTPLMSACGILFWIMADCAAGWICMKIARRMSAAWVLAILITAVMVLNHLILDWDRFPWWYNLGVALPVLPAVLFGAGYWKPRSRTPAGHPQMT